MKLKCEAVQFSSVMPVCSSQVALMGQALCELLRTPDKCRDALRVTLHLVNYLQQHLCMLHPKETRDFDLKNRLTSYHSIYVP